MKPSFARLTAVVVAGVAIALIIMRVSHAGAPARGVAPGPPPVVVPLKVHYGVWGERFPVATVDVRVGNGPRVPVILDTGSTGLHIFQQGIDLGRRGAVAVSGRPIRNEYADGLVQSGVVATARITIGGMTTRRPVPFGLIRDVSCDDRVPYCPGARGSDSWIRHGRYGILGIGLRRDPGGTENPLIALPAAYSSRWSIALSGSNGQLTLAPARRPVLARIQLPRERRSGPSRPTWDDLRGKVCWGAVGLAGGACEPTLFDSGNNLGMYWFGRGLLSHVQTVPGSRLLTPGTYIAAWTPGAQRPFWTITSDELSSPDAVSALPARHTFVWVPIGAFFARTIGYDASRGQILIARG
jgi:hypothetical protein